METWVFQSSKYSWIMNPRKWLNLQLCGERTSAWIDPWNAEGKGPCLLNKRKKAAGLCSVRGRLNTPPTFTKGVYLLMQRPFSVFLPWYRDFADVIKLRILRWRMILDYPDGPVSSWERGMQAKREDAKLPALMMDHVPFAGYFSHVSLLIVFWKRKEYVGRGDIEGESIIERYLVKGGKEACDVVALLSRLHYYSCCSLGWFFFEGYSYLCLFLIPEQLGERTYNPAVIWLVFLESIFKL